MIHKCEWLEQDHPDDKVRWIDTVTGNVFLDSQLTQAVNSGAVYNPAQDCWETGVCSYKVVSEVGVNQYPDGNPKTAQGAKKVSLRYSPTAALIALNAALEDGAKKYGAANWREKGVSTSVYIDAAQRHLALFFDGGERVASDSKVHHLGHAMACLAIILDAEAAGTLNDDRPTPMPNLEALLKRQEA